MDMLVDDVHEDAAKALASLKEAADPVEVDTPEPVKAEVVTDAKPDKLDTKAETKPEPNASEAGRDEKGRFAPKVQAEPAEQLIDKPLDAKPVDPAAVTAGPPGAWSVKAKARWDRIPPFVRDEILKAVTPDQTLGNIKPFAERAKQAGQTLEQALSSYVGIEDALRQNAPQGFMRIAGNMGMTQHQAGQMFLQIAQNLGAVPQGAAPVNEQPNGQGGPGPEAFAPGDPRQLQQLLAPLLQPITQRLEQLDNGFRQQTEVQQNQRLQSANQIIEQFRSDPKNRYYDNVESIIGDLLDKGVVKRSGNLASDLSTAYDMACRLHPEVYEALTNDRLTTLENERKAAQADAAAKARNASRSITGSPSTGASAGEKPKRQPGVSFDDDLYADVRAAVQTVNGRA
jgi:hypothetical protein